MDVTTVEVIKDWLDKYWEDVLDYYGAKMQHMSQTEPVSFSDRTDYLLGNRVQNGIDKIVRIDPQDFVEKISELDEAVRQRCIAAAEEAERQARNASSAATTATQQGDTAQLQGNTAEGQGNEAARQGNVAESQGNTAEQKGNNAQTAADNADASRLAIEANESTRQTNETTRQTNEATRQSQETARETQAASDHTRAESDHTRAESDHSTAVSDHTTAGTDHSTAQSDHTQAGTDHTASVNATNEASNVNAVLVGMTVTITDRNGVSRSQDIGFEIAPENVYASKAEMIADAANVLAGRFCMIATTDPTSTDNATLWSRNSQPASAGADAFTFLSDLDQASTSAWADWMDNQKPLIEQATSDANDAASLANTKAALADAKAQYAEAQGDRAKGYSDHPWEIRNDGYIYVWDETTGQMVRTNKMIIDFSDLTDEQKEEMAQAFYDTLVFASEQTCEDIITELT